MNELFAQAAKSLTLIATLPIFLITNPNTVSAQVPDGCYFIRSLNKNNQQNNNLRYLSSLLVPNRGPENPNGANVQGFGYTISGAALVQRQKGWKVSKTDSGFILLYITGNRASDLHLDAKSDGNNVGLQRSTNVSHGHYWQIEPGQDGFHFRSLNRNFQNDNFRWLDGASDGKTVKLVNGKSHGTLWKLIPIQCGANYS